MQANTLRLLPLFAFLAGGTGWANGGGNDPYSAERYYSSPQKFIGEKVKVRIFKIEPQPKLTAVDLGYVWFQAHTSREGAESSKIQVRVEQEEAEKFARNFQTENRTGRVVDGIFSSRSASTLSPEIATQISFFLTVGPRAELGQETGETISGSLVVAPAARKIETVATAAGSAEEPKPAAFVGPKLILVRSGSVATLQLREAAKVEAKADVLEVLGHDGSLQTVIGKSSVLAVLPAPVAEASREKAQKAVELYEEVMERHPEAETLLADAHRRWKE
ncbi:MAG: hypothetical protein ACO3E8_06700, partial [Candidatus Methylacidiphilales bacterium]